MILLLFGNKDLGELKGELHDEKTKFAHDTGIGMRL